MSCEYEVKPFPYEFCSGCSLNGCYPWNTNPLLFCSEMGGLYLVVIEKRKDGSFSCMSFKRISEEDWKAHLSDLKRMADFNEEMRLKARDGKVLSSELLPDSNTG